MANVCAFVCVCVHGTSYRRAWYSSTLYILPTSDVTMIITRLEREYSQIYTARLNGTLVIWQSTETFSDHHHLILN